MARTPGLAPLPSKAFSRSRVAPDTMVSFRSFVTLGLASTVVASPLELKTESNLGKRDTVDCPDSDTNSFLSDALSEAIALANGAITYINDRGVNDNAFVAYFGSVQDAGPILTVFTNVASVSTPTLSCYTPDLTCASNNDVANFGTFNEGLNIYFCPSFYHQPNIAGLCAKNSDSDHNRDGAVLQQLTSSIDQTTPVYRCLQAWAIALADPATAARTGDNYRCFAEQVYINTNCPG